MDTLQRNKQVITRIFTEGFGEGRYEVVDECLAEDAVDRHAFGPDEPDMRAHLKNVMQMIRAAMPDLEVSVEDLVAEGDHVAARVVMTGTHTGTPLFGRAAKGRPVRVEQFHLVGFTEDGLGLTHQANVGEQDIQAQIS